MDALEVYVLCNERSAAVANRFLDSFAECRSPVAADFPFPEFSDEPEFVFTDPSKLIELLELRGSETYSIYWNVEQGMSGGQVMLFFTEDGNMIAGIGGPLKSVEKTLLDIQAVVKGGYGYVTSGSCPPFTGSEFKEICKQSTLVNLYEGELRTHP